MLMLLGVKVEAGACIVVAVEAAAAAGGGCRYNFVTICLLGIVSVKYSGAITKLAKTSAWKAKDPTAA